MQKKHKKRLQQQHTHALRTVVCGRQPQTHIVSVGLKLTHLSGSCCKSLLCQTNCLRGYHGLRILQLGTRLLHVVNELRWLRSSQTDIISQAFHLDSTASKSFQIRFQSCIHV